MTLQEVGDIEGKIEELGETLERSFLAKFWRVVAVGSLAYVSVVAGAVWFLAEARGEVRGNSAEIMELSVRVDGLTLMAERMARFETTMSAIDNRTQRIERQMDSIWSPARRTQEGAPRESE